MLPNPPKCNIRQTKMQNRYDFTNKIKNPLELRLANQIGVIQPDTRRVPVSHPGHYQSRARLVPVWYP